MLNESFNFQLKFDLSIVQWIISNETREEENSYINDFHSEIIESNS